MSKHAIKLSFDPGELAHLLHGVPDPQGLLQVDLELCTEHPGEAKDLLQILKSD